MGITTVGGNVVLSHVLANVLSCSHVTGTKDVKIYKGAESALLKSHASASFWHGDDGFGDILTSEDRQKDKAFDKQFSIVQADGVGNRAVTFIIDTIMNSENKSVELITLGPLTNIALALKIESRISERLKSVLIMGGSVKARGNITSVAEFNVYADAEASYICFSELQNIILVDWETVLNHSVETNIWTKLSNGSFIGKIANDVFTKSVEAFNNFPIPDALAMAAFLRPECILESCNKAIDIELQEGSCRGVTIVHWRDEKPEQKKIKIVTKIDMNIFHKMLELSVKFK